MNAADCSAGRRLQSTRSTSSRLDDAGGRVAVDGQPDRRHVLAGQVDLNCHQVLVEVSAATGAGDGHHHRGAVQQPCQCELGGCCAVLRGQRVEHATRFSELAGGERRVRHEGDFGDLAVTKNLLEHAVRDVVLVLHRSDINLFAGLANVTYVHLGQADVVDLSLGLHVREHGELVFHRHGRVDAVEVVQVYPFDLEPP